MHRRDAVVERKRAILCNASLPGGAGRAAVQFLKAGTRLNSGRTMIGERAEPSNVVGRLWRLLMAGLFGFRAQEGSRHSKYESWVCVYGKVAVAEWATEIYTEKVE